MKWLSTITPVLLTWNEEPNLLRTLGSLGWAKRIVIVDSGSTDRTEAIARASARVQWHVRKFDSHAAQWAFGVSAAGDDSEYVLALDADMQVPPALLEELEKCFLPGDYAGGMLPFEYRLSGRPLRGSVCPPQLRVFRRADVRIEQAGHTQRFSVAGRVYRFRQRLIHDDRKPLERWLAAQGSYSALEIERLRGHGRIRWRDRLRAAGLMPPIAAAVAYLRAGGPFGGAAAVRYAYERAVYESLLAIRAMNARLEAAEEREG